MKKILYLLCAVLLLASCNNGDHIEPQPGKNFVTVALLWQDKLNTADDIRSIHLWIYDKTGKLAVEKEYPSAKELASHNHEVAVGNIVVVVAVNVEEPLEAQHKATPADLKFELARQCALHEMTYYADRASTVHDDARTVVVLSLHDKPHDDTFIDPDPDVDDWEDGEESGDDIFKPN